MATSKISIANIDKDPYGVKLKFPNRKCRDCLQYPCFSGMEKCVSNFAAYGCIYYRDRNS